MRSYSVFIVTDIAPVEQRFYPENPDSDNKIGIKENFTTFMPRQIEFTIITTDSDVIRIAGLKISWFATHKDGGGSAVWEGAQQVSKGKEKAKKKHPRLKRECQFIYLSVGDCRTD